MFTRRVETCAPGHECTMDEVNAQVDEYYNMYEDTSVTKHKAPSARDLAAVVKAAEGYTGEWYHSYVVLDMESEDAEYAALRERIIALGPQHGIYMMYEWPADSAKFERMIKEKEDRTAAERTSMVGGEDD